MSDSPSPRLRGISALLTLLLLAFLAIPQPASAQDGETPPETTPAAVEPEAPAETPATTPPAAEAEVPAEAPAADPETPPADPEVQGGEGEPATEAGGSEDGQDGQDGQDGAEGAGEDEAGEQEGDADSGAADAPPSAPAEPRFSVEELLELQRGYDEAVGDEAEALALWELADQQRAEIEARSSRVIGMLAWTELELKVAKDDHQQAVVVREQTEEELARVRALLEDEVTRLKRQAVEAFMGGSSSNENILETVLNAGSIDEVESVREYAHVALDDQEEVITSIEDLEILVDELLVVKNAAEREAQVALNRVEAFETQVSSWNTELAELRDLAELEATELRRQLAEIQTVRTDFEQRLNALEQDSDSASAALQRAQANQTPGAPPLMHRPLLVTQISSGFGPRLHPIWGNVRMHNGLDAGGSSGDEIYAAAAGVVVMAELRGGYGNTVVIDHGDQWGTLYAHQSAVAVVPGQQVARGEVIGWVGSTGHSTGPHLHFELRQFGAPRDPINHIDFEAELPVTCDVLIRTGHINDLDAAQGRDDCAEYFEQD